MSDSREKAFRSPAGTCTGSIIPGNPTWCAAEDHFAQAQALFGRIVLVVVMTKPVSGARHEGHVEAAAAADRSIQADDDRYSTCSHIRQRRSAFRIGRSKT